MNYTEIEQRITALGDNDKNTAAEVRIILFALLEGCFQPGDVKEVDCTQQELLTDYDPTGLGRGKRAGWAICNGLNNTQPRGGRTSIGYSDQYPVLGALGGEEKHQLTIDELPEHDHDVPYNNNNAGGNGAQRTLDNSGGSTDYNKTKKTGADQAHNNMQPYIVSLFIQKL